MCSIYEEDTFVQVVKDHVAIAHYFNTTTDEFIETGIKDKTRTVYIDTFLENVKKFAKKLKVKYPDVSDATHTELMKNIYDVFDEYLMEYLDHLEDYAASTVFLKSKTIELEKDKPIIKAVEAFSKEENDQIDNKIREAKERIKKKTAFIELLRERLQLFDLVEKAWKRAIE